MQIPQAQKEKLIAVVEAIPDNKSTIDKWVSALKQDDVPKDMLFDILAGIQTAIETKDQVKDDPNLNNIINKIEEDLKAGTDQIEQDMTSAETKISQIDRDLNDLKKEIDEQNVENSAPPPVISNPNKIVGEKSHEIAAPSATRNDTERDLPPSTRQVGARDDNSSQSQLNPPVNNPANPPNSNPGGEYYT